MVLNVGNVRIIRPVTRYTTRLTKYSIPVFLSDSDQFFVFVLFLPIVQPFLIWKMEKNSFGLTTAQLVFGARLSNSPFNEMILWSSAVYIVEVA